jgi:hypothetical protein
MHALHFKLVSLVATVAIAAAAAAVTFAQEPAPAPAPDGDTPGKAIPLEARNAVSALRRARTQADNVPANISPLVQDVATVAGARRVQLSATRDAYVMPSSDDPSRVCLLTPGRASCPPSETLADQGLIWQAGFVAGEPNRVEGIVADGIDQVVLSVEGGPDLVATTPDNGFAFSTDSKPMALSWDGRDGHHSVPVSTGGNDQ